MNPHMITAAEAADLLGVNRVTVIRWAHAETLVAQQLPGRTGAYLFDRRAVEALAAKRADAAMCEADRDYLAGLTA